MLNFTVGPVMSSEEIRAIAGAQIPYFRTPEFSDIMLESEALMKTFTGAEDDARVVFLTGSGTAAMEAAVMNSFTTEDKVLVVNGGSFGARFVELCQIHQIPCTELRPEFGYDLTDEMLAAHDGQGYTGFLVNLCETSTGVLYDLDRIADFCRRNGLFLIVDAISAFLCDPIDMRTAGISILLTGSQKALACAPGASILVLSSEAIERINRRTPKTLYLDLQRALKDGERGQTPFTPAVGVLLQIHARLKAIEKDGGVESEIRMIHAIARDFRERIRELPFAITSHAPAGSVTPLHPLNAKATDVFTILKDEYLIWICPNGGDLKDEIFRVGHIGDLSSEDNATLVAAFRDMMKRGLL